MLGLHFRVQLRCYCIERNHSKWHKTCIICSISFVCRTQNVEFLIGCHPFNTCANIHTHTHPMHMSHGLNNWNTWGSRSTSRSQNELNMLWIRKIEHKLNLDTSLLQILPISFSISTSKWIWNEVEGFRWKRNSIQRNALEIDWKSDERNANKALSAIVCSLTDGSWFIYCCVYRRASIVVMFHHFMC